MMPKYTRRMSHLCRWDCYSPIVAECKKSKKTKNVHYSKGGCGIETQPFSKRKPNDAFNIRKVKGRMPYKGIVRERSKSEVRAWPR